MFHKEICKKNKYVYYIFILYYQLIPKLNRKNEKKEVRLNLTEKSEGEHENNV